MRLHITILFAALFALVACQKAETDPESGLMAQSELSLLNAPASTTGLRVFTFDTNQKLVRETSFATYPTTLRSPVGKFYFVFVANASGANDIPPLTVGVTTMSSVLHSLTMAQYGTNYLPSSEYYLYATPTAIDLNSVASLSVPLKRSVGALKFAFTPSSSMEEVYVNIAQPVTSIDFRGNAISTSSTGAIRYRLTKDTDGVFKGEFACFPQTNAAISYDVIYNQGTTQNYPLTQPVDITAGVITTIATQFSGTVTSTINYTTWSNTYTINYYAGFQVNVTVQGGAPSNYTGLTVTVKNISVTPNVTTQYTNIPLVNNNGTLLFDAAKFIGNGSYVVTSARLHDRDGALDDPNARGTAIAVTFNVPGKAAAITLDGRQNEEEYYVRKVVAKMCGTATAGVAYPGAATYLTRCIPSSLPTQIEGTEVKQWPVSAPGGAIYGFVTRVINGEWRLVTVNFESDTSPFSNAPSYDSRFLAGGGSLPVTEFASFLYLEGCTFGKLDLKYGSDLSGFANVRNLNTLVINTANITSANKLTGTLPLALVAKDMVRFECSYTNITATFPTSYGTWSNMNTFQVIGNTGLTGTLPKEYASFARIVLMRLNDNNLSGKVPVEFENYASMNVGINFNGNKFSCMPPLFLQRYTTNASQQQGATIGSCTYP